MQPSYALATLPRPVKTPEATLLVRPATVREAVLLYRSAWGAQQGQEGAEAVFVEVLGGWLPAALLTETSALLALAGLDATLQHVIPLLEAGTEGLRFPPGVSVPPPAAEAPADAPADPLERLASEDWDALVFDVAGVFDTCFTEVWGWPWPGFLYAVSRMERVLARKQLRQGLGASLPWLGEDGLQRLLARARSGDAREEEAPPVVAADPPMDEVRWEAIRKSRAALYQRLTGKPDPTGGGPSWAQYQTNQTETETEAERDG